MHKIFLSVVIPCFDEMANLRKGVLEDVASFLNKKKFDYEVLVIDDGSRDGSVEFVEEFVKNHKELKLIKNTHLGKAGAVTTGVLKSQGEYVLFTDMDQATPIEEVDKFLPFFKEEFDVVIGSRSMSRKGSPPLRILISWAAIILRKIIVGMSELSDTQCGFKAFKGETGRSLFEKIQKLHKGFKEVSGSAVTSGFDVELLHLAKKMGYSIAEVPVDWRYVETRRVNPMKDSVDGVLDLLRIKINDMRGKYN